MAVATSDRWVTNTADRDSRTGRCPVLLALSNRRAG
jgi:hypothetical protein